MNGDGYREDIPEQVLIYEKKGNSAVIWRCFSHEDRVVIPAQVDGLPVTELAPYCFSAHMDRGLLEKGIKSGRLYRAGAEIFLKSGESGESQGLLEPCGSRPEGDGMPPELCGGRLRELVLPATVKRAGRYCFYNCEQLHYLEFHGGLTDWGSGVFTGCHQMSSIRLHLEAGEKSMLKEVLDEVPEALRVEYLVEGEQTETAVLTFPEFYEEGVENTPARILETHVHGSGILYRNCFRSRVFDFQQYDRMFPHGKAQEPFEVLADLVTGRLWYPYRLSEAARGQYEAFAEEERESFAMRFSEKKDMQGIRWLTELLGGRYPELCDRMMELASGRQFAEAVSYLMDRKHQEKKRAEETDQMENGLQEKKKAGGKRRRFEL